MIIISEIYEQPERIKELLNSQREHIERIAKKLQQRDTHYVFLAARGTSGIMSGIMPISYSG